MLTTSGPAGGAGEPDAAGDRTPLVDLLDCAPAVDRELPCRREPDLWFAETPGELERAKSLCDECPIKAQCLEGAVSRGEPWGVWGGEIFERGSVVARKRPRGRPRKQSEQGSERKEWAA